MRLDPWMLAFPTDTPELGKKTLGRPSFEAVALRPRPETTEGCWGIFQNNQTETIRGSDYQVCYCWLFSTEAVKLGSASGGQKGRAAC